MADIRLISILPQAPIKGPATPQSAGGSASVPNLSSLESGSVLSGFIINRDASGNPVLRTESGDITFASNFFLKIGSEVVIRIDTAQGHNLARILTVDGQPPEVAEHISSFAKQPEVVVSQHYKPPSPLVSLNASVPANTPPQAAAQPSITVFGTLIKQPAPLPGQPAPPALPTGTHLTLKLVSIEQPAPVSQNAAPPAPGQPHPTAPSTASYAAYTRATATPAQATTPSSLSLTPATSASVSPATHTPSGPPQPQVNLSPPQPAQSAPVSQNVTPPAPAAINQPAPQAANPLANSTTPPAPPAQSTPNLPPTAPNPAQTVQTPPQTTRTPAQTLPNTAQTTTNATYQFPASPPSSTPAPVTGNATISGHATPQPLAGQLVTAHVLGHEPTGEALVQTPLGVVRLQPETMLPSGSRLTFQMLQTTPPALSSLSLAPAPGQPISATPAPLLELAQQWSSLQQIFNLLAGRFALLEEPPALSIPGLATSPQTAMHTGFTPKDIGPGLLLFLSALRGGDLRGWLGRENTRFLEDAGHGTLLKKAEGEFQSIATQYADPKPGQWQALFFPVAVDGLPQQVRLFTKRDREKQQGGSAEQKTADTRFVVEVDLSALGEIQMDGFVRKQQGSVNFDLVIRSLQPLEPQVQQDILAIYNATGEIAGYRGSLAFQAVREFPVNPMEDIVAAHNAFTA